MINILNPAATTSSGQKEHQTDFEALFLPYRCNRKTSFRTRIHFQDLSFLECRESDANCSAAFGSLERQRRGITFCWNQKCWGHLLYVIYVLFAYYSPFWLFAQRVSRIACDPRKVEHATSQIHQVGYKPYVICKTIWRSQVISLPNEPSMGFSKEPRGN